jgi:hypothetical protein
VQEGDVLVDESREIARVDLVLEAVFGGGGVLSVGAGEGGVGGGGGEV